MSEKPATKGKRAAIYIRKSQVYKGVRYISPEMQREACIRWCEAEGYSYEVFADVEGHSSGGTDKRPGYQELRRRLKEFNAVVIHSLSRLSRNKRDYFAFLEDIRKLNIDFVCITQKIDTTTPYGRAFLAMAVVWAELERELDAERAIQWIAAKQARGEHFGTVPLGFSRPNGALRLAANRREDKLVRQIFDLYGTGAYSDLSLARHLNLRGHRARDGHEVTEKMVRTVLNNFQLYRGYIKRHWRATGPRANQGQPSAADHRGASAAGTSRPAAECAGQAPRRSTTEGRAAANVPPRRYRALRALRRPNVGPSNR